MNGSASIVIIVIGLIMLYLGITGKLDCLLDAWNTCRQAQAGGAVPTGLTDSPLPTVPNNPIQVYQKIISPTFPQQTEI